MTCNIDKNINLNSKSIAFSKKSLLEQPKHDAYSVLSLDLGSSYDKRNKTNINKKVYFQRLK